MLKPNEFFLSLTDFIALFLPGAVLACIFLGLDATHPEWFLYGMKPLYTFALAEEWRTVFYVGFAFASFGFGYLLSSFASGLDNVYPFLQKQIYPYYKDILEDELNARRKNEILTPADKEQMETIVQAYCRKWWRRTVHVLFEMEPVLKVSGCFEEADRLRKTMASAAKAENTFKWSCVLLGVHFPAAAEKVNREMAASKFFRSMVMVSILYCLFAGLGTLDSVPLWPGVLSILLSFREYIVQRRKATESAYNAIVALLAYAPKESCSPSAGSSL